MSCRLSAIFGHRILLMSEKHYDVLIAGAGPAGCSAALKLADTGLSVALFDKASFPRDKTCGDALSVDVINQLSLLSANLPGAFQRHKDKMPSYGVRIYSPDHNHVDIPFVHQHKKSCGFIMPRLSFDHLLVEEVKRCSNITVFEACAIRAVVVKDNAVQAETDLGSFRGQLIIGADGAHSVVAKNLGPIKVERKHYSAGLRVYYENVASFHAENFIELHFFRHVLPCYLWIFPLADNRANVGIGMLSSAVAQKKINLKETLTQLLKTHPHLQERFKEARPLETIKGFGLPLGSKKRQLSGERFLLTGDAGALIDPFSGEGIANAIRSGRVAAGQVLACFAKNDFSASFNKAYDKEIYRRMWNEFKISRTLQKLVCFPAFFNFVVRKAAQSKAVQGFLIDALANVEKKKKMLWKPAFYYRMFVNR